jgi:hypothetical protein
MRSHRGALRSRRERSDAHAVDPRAPHSRHLARPRPPIRQTRQACGQRALGAEDRAERADEREERRDERDAEEAVARRRGKPVVVERGGSGGPAASAVRHDYAVRNAGQATISELWLWIEDESGNAVSTRADGTIALVPG